MELLQFVYFSRRPNVIIGVDAVEEMIETCKENLRAASSQNSWFHPEYVQLRHGDALHLPPEDESIDVSQNCLFTSSQTVI